MKPIWSRSAVALVTAALASPAAEPQPANNVLPPTRVVQPVHEYFVPFAPGPDFVPDDFNALYTHIGTDFGRMGPGEQRMTWESHAARVDLQGSGWTGMWHSLAGLARERGEELDFQRCYPPFIADRFQPRCVGVTVKARGTGQLKLEVKSADEGILWKQTLDLHGEPTREIVFDCDPAAMRHAKLLNWVAEPGAQLAVDALGLLVEYPAMPYAERVFLTSYAKLARCYVPAMGTVKDRLHVPAGTFDGLPATGMFALATAAACNLGMVDRPFAEQTLRTIHRTTNEMPRASGLLPHFVRRDNGHFRLLPGTEYSTIDTSLYFHGMLLASQVLHDLSTQDELIREVKSIGFEQFRDNEGQVTHGVREDGRTPLGWSWGEWGGETALAILLERMAARSPEPPRMNGSGKVAGGIGFIGEVQSLFYPQFNSTGKDKLSKVCWAKARRELLREQMEYFPRERPDSAAAKLGLYGLSAGEAYRSRGYVAFGTGLRGADLIHPHYILMSGQLRKPEEAYATVKVLESNGLLPPWGLVENVKADLSEYTPLIGSLNAAFECLGAYHLGMKAQKREDAVYTAARECVPLARAAETFFPAK